MRLWCVLICCSLTSCTGLTNRQTITKAQRSATNVTKANFERLTPDMNKKQVTDILGPVTTVKYEAQEPSTSAAVYEWGTTETGFIICQFQNDKMVGKSQISLRN